MRIREHTLTYLMDARVFVDLEGESEDSRRVSGERLGIHLYSTSMYEDTYAHVCSRMLSYAHICSRMLTYAHGIHLYSTSMYEDTYIAYVCGHIEMRDASPASSSAFTRERLGIHSCY